MNVTQFFKDVGHWVLNGSERSAFISLAKTFGETPESRQGILEAISMRYFASSGRLNSTVGDRLHWVSSVQRKYPGLLEGKTSGEFVGALKKMLKAEGIKLGQSSFGEITPLQVLRLLKGSDADLVLGEMGENTFQVFTKILGVAKIGKKLDDMLPQLGIVVKYGYRPIGIAAILGTLLGGYPSYLLISAAVNWLSDHDFSVEGMSDQQVQGVVESILEPLGSELPKSTRKEIVGSTIGFTQVLNSAYKSAKSKSNGKLPADYLSQPAYKSERDMVTVALANYVGRISNQVTTVKSADEAFWKHLESALSEVEEATGTVGMVGNQDGRQILHQKATGQISKFDPSLLVQVDAARFDSIFVDRCLALREASSSLKMSPKQVLTLLNLASVDATYQRAMVIALSRGLI